MKKSALLLGGLAASLLATSALAQDINVKIGVLNDRSGIYADLSGEGSVIAARMAAEDFDAAGKGITSRSSRPTIRTDRTWPRPSPASGSMKTASMPLSTYRPPRPPSQ